MKQIPLNKLSNSLQAMKACKKSGNVEWEQKHRETIEELCQLLPSGSGFDGGTKLNEEKSSEDKIVFETSFHHMNDGGFYDGWTSHSVIVTPSFIHGFHLRITGQNKANIKEYINDVFRNILTAS